MQVDTSALEIHSDISKKIFMNADCFELCLSHDPVYLNVICCVCVGGGGGGGRVSLLLAVFVCLFKSADICIYNPYK